jgi:hypothetical protein
MQKALIELDKQAYLSLVCLANTAHFVVRVR